jgi:hypothetical protein
MRRWNRTPNITYVNGRTPFGRQALATGGKRAITIGPIRGFRLPGEDARLEQFRDPPRDRETRGQTWRFYAKQVDQASDPVFVLSLDQEIGR